VEWWVLEQRLKWATTQVKATREQLVADTSNAPGARAEGWTILIAVLKVNGTISTL